MRFIECFTVDLKSRNPGKSYRFPELFHALVFNVGYRALVYYRVAMYLRRSGFPASSLLSGLILIRLSRVPGIRMNCKYEIGAGLIIAHPNDIGFGKGCRVGKNVTIFQGVSLGAKNVEEDDDNKCPGNRYPTIEDNVIVFQGAKILGPVTIGANSIVGANAVVTKSFPPNSVIIGVPARLLRTRKMETNQSNQIP
jgi:serine O-acetyltransferase